MHKVIKTYGHELGLSCCFRQWRATSHCNQFHGYALAFKLTFSAVDLDHCNWVIDFGALKPLKERLQQLFDHTLALAADDPCYEQILALHETGLANIVTFPKGVGCERFAELVGCEVMAWLTSKEEYAGRVLLDEVECREHGANAAIWVSDYEGGG